ncbi:hypothetical protein ACFX1X_004136 [Malus domestica]
MAVKKLQKSCQSVIPLAVIPFSATAVQWLCSVAVLSDGSGGASSSVSPPWLPPLNEIDKTKVCQLTPKGLLSVRDKQQRRTSINHRQTTSRS